jgi:Domain of unknown function (DUF1735)
MKIKNISLAFLSLAFITGAGTGCLKDKGFEDQKYGTQVKEIKAVAFPQASTSPVVVGITGSSDPVKVRGPLLTLEAGDRPSAPVNIKLEYDQAEVTVQGLVPLPNGSFSLSTLNVVIPKDSTYIDNLELTVNNSDQLNPDNVYGVGFKIVSADGGYAIAGNQKKMVLGLSIKNKYDGVYTLRVKSTGWAAYGIADGVTGSYPEEIELLTAGSNSVTIFSTFRRDNLLPAFTGGTGVLGGPTAFGATSPLFTFNNANNSLTNVSNILPDDGRGRALLLNPAVTDSRFDPATKKIYAAFIMKQNGRPDQFFYDTLTYVRPRD